MLGKEGLLVRLYVEAQHVSLDFYLLGCKTKWGLVSTFGSVKLK